MSFVERYVNVGGSTKRFTNKTIGYETTDDIDVQVKMGYLRLRNNAMYSP